MVQVSLLQIIGLILFAIIGAGLFAIQLERYQEYRWYIFGGCVTAFIGTAIVGYVTYVPTPITPYVDLADEKGGGGGEGGGSGTDDATFAETGNVKGSSWTGTTVDGGSYRGNAFRLYDMMGNAGEWTRDCWAENNEGRPRNGDAVRGGGDCSARSVRDGSWDERATDARPATRRKVEANVRDWRTGFRVMRLMLPDEEVPADD